MLWGCSLVENQSFFLLIFKFYRKLCLLSLFSNVFFVKIYRVFPRDRPEFESGSRLFHKSLLLFSSFSSSGLWKTSHSFLFHVFIIELSVAFFCHCPPLLCIVNYHVLSLSIDLTSSDLWVVDKESSTITVLSSSIDLTSSDLWVVDRLRRNSFASL